MHKIVLTNPSDSKSQSVYVSDGAEDTTDPDPLHESNDTSTQILGPGPGPSTPLLMGGFVFNYTKAANGNVDIGKNIMKCYSLETLPALSTLAKEFCLCDGCNHDWQVLRSDFRVRHPPEMTCRIHSVNIDECLVEKDRIFWKDGE